MARNAVAFEDNTNDFFTRPGAYKFVHYADAPDVSAGIVHACPCGCGGASALWFKGLGRGHPEWEVTGSWPRVTLRPSIGIFKDESGQFHWHGYLEDGVFVER